MIENIGRPLMTTLGVLISVAWSRTHCPSICNTMACVNGVLSCSKPGLINMPTQLPLRTDKVLLINQDFSRARELSYSNISQYGPPEFRIIKITIQHSKLIGIASETFSHLHNLRTLDISFNWITVIKPQTFEALNLNFLRLDGNPNLQFHCTSFTKSIIRHLSLINCSISSLDFCTLKPIIGVLKKLMLSHNFLKTIDQKFELLFQRLEEIRLNDNTFHCSGCQLKWLSHILKWRFSKLNYSHFGEKNLEEIFPKCVEPHFLLGNFIHRVADEDFVCSSPAIRSIDILIDKFEKLTLSCNSFSLNDKVVWMRSSDRNQVLKSRTIVEVHRREEVQNYFCLVSNRKGNISTAIKIHWPQALEIRDEGPLLTTQTAVPFEGTLYSPRFSLLELIAAIVSTFTIFLVVFIVLMKYSLTQKDSKLFQFPNIEELKNNLQSNGGNHASLIANYNYHDAEVVRYDWSGNNSFGNSQTYDFPVSPGSIFLDFKTHEQIQKS